MKQCLFLWLLSARLIAQIAPLDSPGSSRQRCTSAMVQEIGAVYLLPRSAIRQALNFETDRSRPRLT